MRVNWLMTFNNQSCSYNAPLGQTNARAWGDYINHHYIPGLRSFMDDNVALLKAKGSGAAFEIWNEENCWANNSYIPPQIYGPMLAKASSVIQAWNKAHHARVETIMGGLCDPKGEADHNSHYAQTVLQTGGAGLRAVRAIGIHSSYGIPEPGAWSSEIAYFRGLVKSYSSLTGHHDIWVTETGSSGELGSRYAQASFTNLLFGKLEAARVPVVIWYAYSDRTEGRGGYGGWGLFDKCGVLKPSGAKFDQFARGLKRTPPPGSTTRADVVGIAAKPNALSLTINVSVTCPAGTEDPWRDVSLTDVVAHPNGTDKTPGVTKLTAKYRTGGAVFTLALSPGEHSIIGAYEGDYQLEGGASEPITLTLARCPGSPVRSDHASVECSGATLQAAKLIASEYQSNSRQLGKPLAGGVIAPIGHEDVAFFSRRVLIVQGSSVKIASSQAIVKLLKGHG
jgi:hypothetical protein